MDGDNSVDDAIKGDVIPDSIRRVSGRKGSDNGLIEIALVGHPHRYRVRIDRSGPVPRLVELHLVPVDDAEIDPATIRQVPVRRLTKAAARFALFTEHGVGVAGDLYDPTDLQRPDHRGNRKLDEVHYRQVARLLMWAREIGESPREFVRERFSPVSVPTVDRWIAEAKRRKFLPRDWATTTATTPDRGEATTEGTEPMTAPRLLTVGQTAERFGVDSAQVRRWIKAERCPIIRDGRKVRIPSAWVDQELAR